MKNSIQYKKASESNKRMFYRLLNHLQQKRSVSELDIPIEYLEIIKRYEQKKSPLQGIY